MTITADLKLSFPIRWGSDGKPLIWCYHTPISREVFQANWRILAATKHAIFLKGSKFAADEGPQIASLAFQDASKADVAEYDTSDGGRALLAELKRLTMVLAPTPAGYETLPVEVAVARGIITADDWADTESALVFFTCAYAMAPRQRQAQTADALALVLLGSITSLQITEWAVSLQQSMTAEAQAPEPAPPQ